MDMLVKLYDLPDSRAAFERLRGAEIALRRETARCLKVRPYRKTSRIS